MKILRSDKTGEIEGYLVTIKLLNTGLLNDNTIFEEIEIKNEKTTSTDLKLNFELLKNINIKIETTSSNILNRIDFFDHNNEYIISINTSNKRELLKNSKETIYIFNFYCFNSSIFGFILFTKNQYLIQNRNVILNKEVEKRTRQLDKALE